jgi:DNA-binding Lrp family transcriptional regulator
MITAFVLIDAIPDRIAELGPELAGIDGVAEVHSIAGSVDLVAVVRVPSHELVADVVTQHIGRLAGVTSTETLIGFRSYSRADEAAAFEGFGD